MIGISFGLSLIRVCKPITSSNTLIAAVFRVWWSCKTSNGSSNDFYCSCISHNHVYRLIMDWWYCAFTLRSSYLNSSAVNVENDEAVEDICNSLSCFSRVALWLALSLFRTFDFSSLCLILSIFFSECLYLSWCSCLRSSIYLRWHTSTSSRSFLSFCNSCSLLRRSLVN